MLVSKHTITDIGKAKDNYDKDRKPRYFNCNININTW